MESLSYLYKDIDFLNLMKAQFMKYFDEVYKDKNQVIEMNRKYLNKDTVEIVRIHKTEFAFINYFFIETIQLNRKEKTYKSSIDCRLYKEECIIKENGNDVEYTQNYEVPFYYKSKKKNVFNAGCQVIEKIIKQNNLRI